MSHFILLCNQQQYRIWPHHMVFHSVLDKICISLIRTYVCSVSTSCMKRYVYSNMQYLWMKILCLHIVVQKTLAILWLDYWYFYNIKPVWNTRQKGSNRSSTLVTHNHEQLIFWISNSEKSTAWSTDTLSPRKLFSTLQQF